MEMKLTIPDFLSVKQWKVFTSLEHLSDTEKMIKMIALLSDKEEDEVKTWSPTSLSDVYGTILEAVTDLQPSFYPIFELDGVKYGYTPMSRMTLGEYVDLERLAKKSHDNIEEIMAILYRPITKHKFNGIKWAFKNTFKVKMGDAENLFKYYETEAYDSSEREENSKKLAVLPASMALGALGFFLVVASTSLLATNHSSTNPKEQMKMVKEMSSQMASMNIGDGLLQFITSQQHPSFQSQAIATSLN